MHEPIINPDLECLRKWRGVVYGLRNKKIGRFYIGQTIRSFRIRYGRAWWKIKPKINKLLATDVAKYGPQSFEIWIFAHSIKSQEELDQLESYYAKQYDAYAPTGYNLFPCGKEGRERNWKRFEHLKGELNAVHRGRTKLKRMSTGETFETNNLSQFCRDHDVEYVCIWDALKKGPRAVYKDFTHINTTNEDVRKRKTRFGRGEPKGLPSPPYILWKNGVRYEFPDILAIRENHEIPKGHEIYRVLRGEVRSAYGFSLDEKSSLQLNKRGTSLYRDLVLKGPDNAKIKFNSVTEAIKTLKCSYSHLTEMLNGRWKTCKGFELVSVEKERKPLI